MNYVHTYICTVYVAIHAFANLDILMVGIKKGTFCNCAMNRTTVLCIKTTMRTTQNNKLCYAKL